MIYTIYCDGELIHTSNVGYGTEGYFVESPSLTKTDNQSDSLSFKVPYSNISYNKIKVLSSTLTVIRTKTNGTKKCIFYGRPTEASIDMDKSMNVKCEGAYSFLNDIILPKHTFNDRTPGSMFNFIENYYNSNQTAENRQVGLSFDYLPETVQNFKYDFTTIKVALEKLMEGRKMHMYQYQSDDETAFNRFSPHIRYKEDYNAIKTNGPVILFGENLIDYTRDMNLKRYATAVLPLGKTNKKWPYGYVDIAGDIREGETKWERAKRMVLKTSNTEALETYGYIEVLKYWRGQKTSEALKKKAKKWLEKTQFEDLTFSISAIDISDLNSRNGIEKFQVVHDDIDILDRVRVISPPHALDAYLPVTAVTYDLADPSNTNYTFGNVRTYNEQDD